MAAIDTVVAGALDRAADGFLTLGQVSERLTAEAGTLDPASYDHIHLDALRAAVCFRLTADGTFYGDFVGNGTALWPRTLDQVPPDVLGVWQAYAGQARSAGLRAHLHDLLTSAGFPPPYVHARQAIEAYREAVPGFLAVEETNRGRLRAVESLVRALGLAAQMNQRDLRDLVVRDILGLADGLLDADPVPPGLVYRLLEALHARRLEPGLGAGQRVAARGGHGHRAHWVNTASRYRGCQRGGTRQDLRRLLGNGDIPGRRGCGGDPPERFGEAGRLVDLGAGRVQFLLRELDPHASEGYEPEVVPARGLDLARHFLGRVGQARVPCHGGGVGEHQQPQRPGGPVRVRDHRGDDPAVDALLRGRVRVHRAQQA